MQKVTITAEVSPIALINEMSMDDLMDLVLEIEEIVCDLDWTKALIDRLTAIVDEAEESARVVEQ